MPVAATAPWLNNTLAWGEKQTPSCCEYGSRGCCCSLLGCACVWSSRHRHRHRHLMALPIHIVATTTGPSKTISCSTAAPANDSSELACRRDRQVDSSRAQLSPCPPPKKSQISSTTEGRDWGGWRWLSACRGVPVRRRGDTTLHCPHPFRPFCSARSASAVYFEDTSACRTPPGSLAYITVV